jgi:hypothetical protein
MDHDGDEHGDLAPREKKKEKQKSKWIKAKVS